MWSVLVLFVGLTKAVSYVAGITSTVDEKSGKSTLTLPFAFHSFCLDLHTYVHRYVRISRHSIAEGKIRETLPRPCLLFESYERNSSLKRFWGISPCETWKRENRGRGANSSALVSRREQRETEFAVIFLLLFTTPAAPVYLVRGFAPGDRPFQLFAGSSRVINRRIGIVCLHHRAS